MEVRHDMAGLVDHEARAERLLLLLLRRERIAEDRILRDVDDARGRDLYDAGGPALIDLVDRQRLAPGEGCGSGACRRGGDDRAVSGLAAELAGEGGTAECGHA